MDIATNKAGALVLPSQAQKALPYFCLECGDLVYLKLGEIRQAHFSHWPGSTCLGITPHDEAKYKIAKLFSDSSLLGLEGFVICDFGRRCGLPRKADMFFPAYDSVEVEYRYGSVIFDVALLKDSLPVAALEIYSSHASLPEKERANIPYLEIDASEYIDTGRFNFLSKHIIKGSMLPCASCDNAALALTARQQALEKRRQEIEKSIEEQHQAALLRLKGRVLSGKSADRGDYAVGEFVPRYKDGSVIPRDIWNSMKLSRPGGV